MSETKQTITEHQAIATDLVGLPPHVTAGALPPEGAMEIEHGLAALTTLTRVTRAQVLERAQSWIDERVMYSQTAYHSNRFGRYRQDCSGYVSMCWALGTSYTTATFLQVAQKIGWGELQGGDALHRRVGDSGHIALFVGWADGAHTQPIVDEEFDFGHPCVRRAWSSAYAHTFTPIRGHNVGGSVPPGGPKPPEPTQHVFRTWSSGVRIRQKPSTSSAIVTTLPGPTTVEIRCQVHGTPVKAEGITNDAWSFLPRYNGYISNIYIDHPAYWLPGVPSC